MTEDEQPIVYVVRPSNRVADQIEAEHKRLSERSKPAAADEWEEAMMDAIASLATYPKRCPVARENTLFQQINPRQTLHQLIYKQARSNTAWRILFTVHEADTLDPPTVQVHHIRHGAQAPMTHWPDEDE